MGLLKDLQQGVHKEMSEVNPMTLDEAREMDFSRVPLAWAMEFPNDYEKLAIAHCGNHGSNVGGEELQHVPQAWAEAYPQHYTRVALVAARQRIGSWNGPTYPDNLQYVSEAWALAHPDMYEEIASAAVNTQAYNFTHVPASYIEKFPEEFKRITMNGGRGTLQVINLEWALAHPQDYEDLIAQEATDNGRWNYIEPGHACYPLGSVQPEWIAAHPERYGAVIMKRASSAAAPRYENEPFDFQEIDKDWAVAHPEQYTEIMSIVTEKGYRAPYESPLNQVAGDDKTHDGGVKLTGQLHHNAFGI